MRPVSVTPLRMRGVFRASRAARGVGLVEVLVSVLVLSIGLLGIAAMQATALRNSQSSLERSQGIVHVYTILDAMRANPNGVAAGTYNMAMTCAAPGGAGSVAASDRSEWITHLQENLGPTACGLVNCAAGVCTITVQWDDSRGTSGSTTQSFTSRVRL